MHPVQIGSPGLFMRKQIFRRGHGKLFARGELTLRDFNLHGWPVIEMESLKMRTE